MKVSYKVLLARTLRAIFKVFSVAIIACAALSAVSGRDGPICGDIPEERRRLRLRMGVWVLAILVCMAVLDWLCGALF